MPKDDGVFDEIKALEDRRYRAMLAGDAAALDDLCSGDLIYTHSKADRDEYYRLPQWPPLRVHPLDQYGLPDYAQSPYKPKIERSMLNNIRRAAPSIGKIVGKGEIRQRDPTVTGATLGSRPLSST